MHPEDMVLAAVLDPLPERLQIRDPHEEDLPAYERWHTYTYCTDCPDALAWEMVRHRW